MAVVLVLAASVLFGTTGTARALGLDEVDPVAVGAARIALGGLCLGVLAVWLVRSRQPGPARARGPRWRTATLVVAGAAGVVAYQPTFFSGVRSNGVAVGTLVALGSAPVWTGLLSWALSRRFPGRRWVVATAGAIVGVALLSGVGTSDGAGAVSLGGVLASAGAGVAYAAYTVTTKGLLDRGWAPLVAIGAIFGLAGVVGCLQLLTMRSAWGGLGDGIAAVVWLGLAATALAYVLFSLGLARLPAATAATLTLAEPVVATLLGVLLLSERLSVSSLLGIGVLVAALGLLAAPTGRSRRAARERHGGEARAVAS